ncbi:MAG: 50S ribosomal protein L5 [Gemmatimonadota bacterium]|jgi:large subunit ribosomal protein L5|nr:50S ribosomal protein L5 [Gemmatimonadota bacterium]
MSKNGESAGSEAANVPEPRLRTVYNERVRAKLQSEFNYSSAMQIPVLEKIVINVGIGEASKNAKLLESVVQEIRLITGQQPVIRRAKKAISNFGLREGLPVGVSVTLRRERMWEFLDRFINISVPRIRDFRGLATKSFDGRGNYTIGVREQLIFPEIDYDKILKLHGMDITFVTSAGRDDEGLALLRELGMPFRGSIPVNVYA